MKNNYHKKVTRDNKVARKYYCQRARLNSIRTDKKFNKRKFRRKVNKDEVLYLY